ncbi:Cytochrome b/b6, N-terminal [hydrothermal vent metagenome]|uniref:Cytochrome b/b6, N-terminal n=1 Tax=hydrothermal vent metagenome TaxID=652676 RepID=A0A3B1CCF6_9ZZZZ
MSDIQPGDNRNKQGGLLETIIELVTKNPIWLSLFRTGFPNTLLKRMAVMRSSFVMHIFPTKVGIHGLKLTYGWCMGGITFFLFVLLTITGVILMFYYVPDENRAYTDMKNLAFMVPYGRIMRNMHRWGAHAMVFSVIVHMARVFYTGSYKPPRQFNWVVGVLLLKFTLLLSFTGYLLPWDQLGFWAVTVGTNMASATPFIGFEGPFSEYLGIRIDNDIRFALIGGTRIGANALLRAYVWHCVGLPLLVSGMLAFHFWRVRKDGFSGPL